ncbi:hypothetical protein [Dyella silvae]|uniref:bestrophin-like domain n=1 Tax=Dyella silvae TaxID=2994424 RepID=UPI002264F5D1|nr:hypothetical protein [Dyella silvae]
MGFILGHPLVVFVVAVVALWIAGRVGASLAKRHGRAESEEREAFNVLQGATLTLLGLIIGFSFSMAISRYDQRKNYEEAEANAIGTEYVRFDLLPAAAAAKARPLLVQYLDQRIKFYETRDRDQLAQINARTSALQASLWDTVTPSAKEQPSPIIALVVAGMNDVLNSQGYTQAAWWNRIPIAAWILMATIALGCNVLVGIGAGGLTRDPAMMFVLPLVVAVSFMLIADIDSPRGGVIHVSAQNLLALKASLPQT